MQKDNIKTEKRGYLQLKVIRIIGLLCTSICMGLIGLMMLLMVADVLARVLLNNPIPGATEWVQIMLVCCMTSLGASIMTGSMVEINMLTKRLKPRAQLILDIVILTVSLAIIVLIAIQQFITGMKSMTSNVMWTSVKIPQWPFLFLFGVSYGVAALTVLMTIIRKIVALAKGNIMEEIILGSTDKEFAFGKYGMSVVGSIDIDKQIKAKTEEFEANKSAKVSGEDRS